MNEENGVVVVVESGSIQSDKEKSHLQSKDDNEEKLGIDYAKEESKFAKQEDTNAEPGHQDAAEAEDVKQTLNLENVHSKNPSTDATFEDSQIVTVTEAEKCFKNVEVQKNDFEDEDDSINETKAEEKLADLEIPMSDDNDVKGEEYERFKEAKDDDEQVLQVIDESKIEMLQKDEHENAVKEIEIIVPLLPDGEPLQDGANDKEKGSAEFACGQCDKKFTHLSSKKRHMLKHQSGDLPPIVYQCLACSKTFFYNSSLKRHLKLHTEEANGKAYTCKACSKAFMYSTSLKRHLKTHSGKEIFPCPHCHRCFEYLSSLKRHEKLHLVGKGFKCEICMKSFGYLSSLTRHQRIHQKCLHCQKCNKQFRFHKSFVKHMEELHGIDASEINTDEEMQHESIGTENDDAMNVDDCDEKCETNDDINKEDAGTEVKHALESVKINMDDKDETKESNEVSNELHEKVLDLQADENHPFVKFVVSQNTLNINQLQSIQAEQVNENESNETNVVTTSDGNVTFALVPADNNAVIENATLVTEEGQSYPDGSVGGIVFVELDENNKVTERHMEGLQASNLLQLLQAVEGYAVEQTVCLNNDNQSEALVAVKDNIEEQNDNKDND